jgi:hypothetical protein
MWTVRSRLPSLSSTECEALISLLTNVLKIAQNEYLRSEQFAGTFSYTVAQNNNTAVISELVKDPTQKVWLDLEDKKISYTTKDFCLTRDTDCFDNILRTAFGLRQRQSVKTIFTNAFSLFTSSTIHTNNFVLSKHGSRNMRFHIDGDDQKTQEQYGPVIYLIPPSSNRCTSIVVQLVIHRKRLEALHKNALYRPSYDDLLKALRNLENKIDLQSPNLKDCTVKIHGDVERTGTILSTTDKGNTFLVRFHDLSEETVPAHCLDMEEMQECSVPDEIQAACKQFSQLEFALEKKILTAFCLFLSPSKTLTRAAIFPGNRMHGVYNVDYGQVTVFGINCSTRLQEEAIKQKVREEKKRKRDEEKMEREKANRIDK